MLKHFNDSDGFDVADDLVSNNVGNDLEGRLVHTDDDDKELSSYIMTIMLLLIKMLTPLLMLMIHYLAVSVQGPILSYTLFYHDHFFLMLLMVR